MNLIHVPLVDEADVYTFWSISMTRMQISDIELIRYWRNQEQIRSQMVYKGIVTRAEQPAWYLRESAKNANYMCFLDGNPIGLFSLRNFEQKETHLKAESGGFIGDLAQIGSGVAFACSYGRNTNIIFEHWRSRFPQ